MEAAHVANLRHKLGAECGANSEHPHHNGVLRQRCRQGLHFIPERGQRSGSGLELGYRLFHQNLCSIVLWHDAEVPAGRGVNVQRLVLTEVIAMPLTPFLVFGCKCLFGQLANTLTMPKGRNEIHPLLATVRSGGTGKQAVCVQESGVKQGD